MTDCDGLQYSLDNADARIAELEATITSLQSDLAAAEERATYYAANARSMDGPSDGAIYSAVSVMDAIKGERAALARAEAAESDLQRTREALQDAAATFDWLADNQPDCLGWVGHGEPGGPWPEVKERASVARRALTPPTGDVGP
jgi:multidrug efflux pump subunit AcrA (membrane-fusion protein)